MLEYMAFRSIHYLHRTFRAKFGMMPMEYRRIHKWN